MKKEIYIKTQMPEESKVLAEPEKNKVALESPNDATADTAASTCDATAENMTPSKGGLDAPADPNIRQLEEQMKNQKVENLFLSVKEEDLNPATRFIDSNI